VAPHTRGLGSASNLHHFGHEQVAPVEDHQLEHAVITGLSVIIDKCLHSVVQDEILPAITGVIDGALTVVDPFAHLETGRHYSPQNARYVHDEASAHDGVGLAIEDELSRHSHVIPAERPVVTLVLDNVRCALARSTFGRDASIGRRQQDAVRKVDGTFIVQVYNDRIVAKLTQFQFHHFSL